MFGVYVIGCVCKLCFDWDDDMIMIGKCYDFWVDWKIGYDGDGRICVVDMEFLVCCGYFVDLFLGVNDWMLFYVDFSYFYLDVFICLWCLCMDICLNIVFCGFGGL